MTLTKETFDPLEYTLWDADEVMEVIESLHDEEVERLVILFNALVKDRRDNKLNAAKENILVGDFVRIVGGNKPAEHYGTCRVIKKNPIRAKVESIDGKKLVNVPYSLLELAK